MNLPDLIKTGESETVEFKEKFDERTIESAAAELYTLYIIVKTPTTPQRRHKDAKWAIMGSNVDKRVVVNARFEGFMEKI